MHDKIRISSLRFLLLLPLLMAAVGQSGCALVAAGAAGAAIGHEVAEDDDD